MKVVDLYPSTNIFRKRTDKGGIIKYMAVINGKTVINMQLGGVYGNAISHVDKPVHPDELKILLTWPEVTQEEFFTAHSNAIRILENNLHNKAILAAKKE